MMDYSLISLVITGVFCALTLYYLRYFFPLMKANTAWRYTGVGFGLLLPALIVNPANLLQRVSAILAAVFLTVGFWKLLSNLKEV